MCSNYLCESIIIFFTIYNYIISTCQKSKVMFKSIVMIEKIILSIIQAITELFPISSSGHLIIFSEIIKHPIDQLLMIFLHFWTALSIITYYWRKLLDLILIPKERIKILYLIIATIPAGFAGFLFDDMIESYLYSLIIIAINSIFWGTLMIILENQYENGKFKKINLSEFQIQLFTGFAQVLALIPGTSRSGVTTLTAMSLGKNKEDSLDLAFLLGIPITLGPFVIAILKMIVKEDNSYLQFFNLDMLLIGFITFIVGLITLKLLSLLKKSRYLKGFGIYRIILGIILLFFSISL